MLVITNSYLNRFRTQSTGGKSDLLLNQLPRANEVMDLRRQSTIATLQSQYNFLMAFSILFLYSEVSVAISPHQRSFSQMETTTENHD